MARLGVRAPCVGIVLALGALFTACGDTSDPPADAGPDAAPDAALASLVAPPNITWWNPTTGAYESGTTGFVRFCSSTLAARSAFYDKDSKTGTKRTILMNGEENGALGRAFAHVVTGPNAGTSYELPRLGKLSFENAVPNLATGRLTTFTPAAAPGITHLFRVQVRP